MGDLRCVTLYILRKYDDNEQKLLKRKNCESCYATKLDVKVAKAAKISVKAKNCIKVLKATKVSVKAFS